MTEKRAILANPTVNLDADGRLVKLHCGTPGEMCNLDDAKDKETWTWLRVLAVIQGRRDYSVAGLLCTYCFSGGSSEPDR